MLVDIFHHRGIKTGPAFIAGISPGIVTVDSLPASRKILLFERETGKLLESTVAASDGTYRFDDLDPNTEFDLVARDHLRVYRDVVVPAVQPHTYELSLVGSAVPKFLPVESFEYNFRVSGGNPPYTLDDSLLPTDVAATLDGNKLQVAGTNWEDEVTFTVEDAGAVNSLTTTIPPAPQFLSSVLATNPRWFCRHTSSTATNLGSDGTGTYGGSGATFGSPIYSGGDAAWDTAGTSYVSLSSDVLPAGNDAYTLCIIFKRNSNAAIQALIDRDDEGANRIWQWRLNSGQMQWIKIVPSVVVVSESGTTPSGSTCIMFLRVDSSGNVEVFRNGTSIATGTVANQDYGSNTVGLRIGRRLANDNNFDGVISDSVVWNRALTDTEITDLSATIIPI